MVRYSDFSSARSMETQTKDGTVNPLSDSLYQMYSLSLENGYTRDTTQRRNRQRTLENNNVNGIVIYDDPGVKYPENIGEWPASMWKLGPIFSAVFVRMLLICHNVVTVWRVTEDFNDQIFWFLIMANILLIVEGFVVIWKRGGVEYSWWCPCFMMHLCTTIPAIWLLQLNQYNALVSEDERVIVSSSSSNITTQALSTPSFMTSSPRVNATSSHPVIASSALVQKLVTMTFTHLTNWSQNLTTATNNITEIENVTNDSTESLLTGTTTLGPITESTIAPTITSETWLIIVQESLVYLLVFSRWLLPRGEVSREFLADLLLEFLAIASDIMELLAVFDEDAVRSNLTVTLWIMAVWSASFIQFIPILIHKRKTRSFRESPDIECIMNSCGDKFVEIVVTFMSIFLQDGPFLALRLYIIIEVRIVTYSLVFFILKNIVTLLLLVYRLTVMCYQMQNCRGRKSESHLSLPN